LEFPVGQWLCKVEVNTQHEPVGFWPADKSPLGCGTVIPQDPVANLLTLRDKIRPAPSRPEVINARCRTPAREADEVKVRAEAGIRRSPKTAAVELGDGSADGEAHAGALRFSREEDRQSHRQAGPLTVCQDVDIEEPAKHRGA
jgi:hypothetical protein